MTSEMCSTGLRYGKLDGQKFIMEFILRLLEPLQHKSSLVIWSVVLLEDSIFIWEDRPHLRLQLIRNHVQIVLIFHGLFYHN